MVNNMYGNERENQNHRINMKAEGATNSSRRIANNITLVKVTPYIMSTNIHFAILSGICASTASSFGKLSWLPILQEYFLLRIIFFICMIVCNAAVWTLFVKALQQTTSSLSATVISSASNYVFSAITGFVIFGELTSLLWWSGMFLIIIGLLLVLSNDSSTDKNIVNKDK